jgi:mannose-6-phosphate isomerase-like protein (cupin superfamily)
MTPARIEIVHASAEDEAALASVASRLPAVPPERVDYSKVVVRKPWGHEYLLCDDEAVAVWVLYIAPGHETSMHCHRTKRTSLVVLDGRVRCSTLRASRERSAGEGVLLHEGVFHRTRGLSERGALVLEVETPPDKHDLVRLSDRYGRVGAAYAAAARCPTTNHDYVPFETAIAQGAFVKQLGSCALSLLSLCSRRGSPELAALAHSDIVCLVRGEILDARGRPLMRHGDTLTAAALRQACRDRWRGAADLLVTSARPTLPPDPPRAAIGAAVP